MAAMVTLEDLNTVAVVSDTNKVYRAYQRGEIEEAEALVAEYYSAYQLECKYRGCTTTLAYRLYDEYMVARELEMFAKYGEWSKQAWTDGETIAARRW